jgi:UDP-N-acetylmuramoyl-L-alanyl-D-glutamate--2,6-diaminopimelate ligase
MSLAKRSGITHFVLETTSHGLDQNRVFGIHYAISVITNISREHLDYHKSYEKYVEAKSKLLRMSKVAVLNKDDISYPYLLNKWKTENGKWRILTYGLHGDADVTVDKFSIKTSMPGLFNTYNALAALAVCTELGITHEQAAKVISVYETPPGRQDIIQKNPFTVMIDFAHTPNSFSALLSSLRTEYTGKIIHVFGCAGERDQGKRPEMGKISSEYSDVIVLTAEDSRNEKTEEIIADIKSGISNFQFPISNQLSTSNFQIEKNKKYAFEIPDRGEAIEFALSIAEKGDIVVITGKGHEQTMNLGEGEFAWSDHSVTEEALKKYHDKK